ncbi:hypothetical protein JCM11251_007503 [Rhodosporidiobolus azoricus]
MSDSKRRPSPPQFSQVDSDEAVRDDLEWDEQNEQERAWELRAEAARYDDINRRQRDNVGSWQNALFTYEEQYGDIRRVEMSELHSDSLKFRAEQLEHDFNAVS